MEELKPLDREEIERAQEAEFWISEIKRAQKYFEPFWKTADSIIKRYRAEEKEQFDGKRFNVFWANTETSKPAVYNRMPKTEAERRFKDADPIGRSAAMVLERAVDYSVESHQDFNDVMKQCRDDFLLIGRGASWERYVPTIAEIDQERKRVNVIQVVTGPEGIKDEVYEDEDGEKLEKESVKQDEDGLYTMKPIEGVVYEESVTDYVHYKDFIHSPARVWSEVRWVARRAYLSRDSVAARFGSDVAKMCALDHMDEDVKDDKDMSEVVRDRLKKATVWEIWDKETRKVYWINPGVSSRPLDKKEDPLKLKGFFPCPKPLYGTLTSNSLLPRPDFAMYQDQATCLDDLTVRKGAILDAIRVVGVHDKEFTELESLLSKDLETVPVDNWTKFAQTGGLQGAMDFLDISPYIMALRELNQAIMEEKNAIYEISGHSDIMRGATDPRETATAQQGKMQFGSLRLSEKQGEMMRFVRDVVRIKAEIISEHFQPQTLALMAGLDVMPPEAQFTFEQAVGLLRSDPLRCFRIDIETDSTIELDQAGEKEKATEFVQVLTAFIEKAIPQAQAMPQLLPLFTETLMFLVRRYKAGRQMESTIEQTMQLLQQVAQQAQQAQMEQANQPPPPDPAMKQIEQKGQEAQARIQLDAQKALIEQSRAEAELEIRRQELVLKDKQIQLDALVKQRQAEIKAETELAIKAQEAKLKQEIETLKMGLQAEMKAQAALSKAGQPQSLSVTTPETDKMTAVVDQFGQKVDGITQTMAGLANMLATSNKPKRKIAKFGTDEMGNRVAEVVEVD